MTNSIIGMNKETNLITRINKSNKLMQKSLKSDSLCLPSPRLNKRYRYSVLPSVQHFKRLLLFSKIKIN